MLIPLGSPHFCINVVHSRFLNEMRIQSHICAAISLFTHLFTMGVENCRQQELYRDKSEASIIYLVHSLGEFILLAVEYIFDLQSVAEGNWRGDDIDW